MPDLVPALRAAVTADLAGSRCHIIGSPFLPYMRMSQ